MMEFVQFVGQSPNHVFGFIVVAIVLAWGVGVILDGLAGIMRAAGAPVVVAAPRKRRRAVVARGADAEA